MRTLLAIVTAGLLVVALAPDTLAQQTPPAPGGGQAPAAPPAAPKAPAAEKQIEGKVKSVDAAKKIVTLEDGTMLMIADAAKLGELKPGTTIKASYEEKGGQKVVKSLEVGKQ